MPSELPSVAVRPATGSDDGAIWSTLEPMIRAGESDALPQELSRANALAYWRAPGNAVFVAQSETGGVIGTYMLRANGAGGRAHVANCGTSRRAATGRRVARDV